MDVDKIIEVMAKGGLAIVPTDTVYGIIADATNYETIKKVYEVKKRTFAKPLIIMVSSFEMLSEYVLEMSSLEKELVRRYWPGNLTILFHKNEKVNDLITNNSNLVGIRLPDNEELRKVIGALGKPLISTSANVSNYETITNVNMLDKEMVKNIDYIYDGGDVVNTSSTIIKVVNEKIYILREGELALDIRSDYKNNISY